MGAGGSFPGVKRPGLEADHSPPSNAEDKNLWSHTSSLPYVFMAWYLVKHGDNFTLLLVDLFHAYISLHKITVSNKTNYNSFPSVPLGKCPYINLETGHDRIPKHSFQLTIHNHRHIPFDGTQLSQLI